MPNIMELRMLETLFEQRAFSDLLMIVHIGERLGERRALTEYTEVEYHLVWYPGERYMSKEHQLLWKWFNLDQFIGEVRLATDMLSKVCMMEGRILGKVL